MAKVYLNIQEQVEKNRVDILAIQQGATVLAEFGIKVIGHADDSSELPDPATYIEEEEGAYEGPRMVPPETPGDAMRPKGHWTAQLTRHGLQYTHRAG